MADIVKFEGAVSLIDTYRGFDKTALAKLPHEDREIVVATDGKRFQEYSTDELARALAVVFQCVFRDIGYRGTPDDVKYIIITASRILPKYYGTFTIDDFRLAFEMLVTGGLDDYLPRNTQGEPDKKHFNNVNTEYLCRILNAYSKRRREALKSADAVRPVIERPENPKEAAIDRNKIKSKLLDFFDSYKTTRKWPEMNLIDEKLSYELLAGAGLVEALEPPQNEQSQTIEAVLGAKRGQTSKRDAAFDRYVRERRARLRAAFEEFVERGVEISDFLTFEKV